VNKEIVHIFYILFAARNQGIYPGRLQVAGQDFIFDL